MYGVSTDKDPTYTKEDIGRVLREYNDKLWAVQDVTALTNELTEMLFSAKSPEASELNEFLGQAISQRIQPVALALLARGVEPNVWHLRSTALTGQPEILKKICEKQEVPRGFIGEVKQEADAATDDGVRQQYAAVLEVLKEAPHKENWLDYITRRTMTAIKGRE